MRIPFRILSFLTATVAGLVLSGFMAGYPCPVLAKTVTLPLTIDYPLLRALVVQTAFKAPGESATVLEESGGCRKIVISEPAYRAEASRIRFEIKVAALLGTAFGDSCLMPIEWQGYLVFYQEPRLAPDSWTLSFETKASQLYDLQHQPAKIAGIIWDLIKTSVYAYLDAIRIDLAPPVQELKYFLRSLFPAQRQNQAEAMLNSLRPGGVLADAGALRIAILTDVADAAEGDASRQQKVLGQAELAQFFPNWEVWDAFLAQTLSALSQHGLSDDDRQLLLDTLLETRHAFILGIADQSIRSDFVREQFSLAWKRLSPVFRRHLSSKPSASLLGYLGFFTASDALVALDNIGWQLGIEISRDGLVRLARLLSQTPTATLDYAPGVDLRLRQVLGLGPPLEEPGPDFDGESLEIDSLDAALPGRNSPTLLNGVSAFFCRPAWAATSKKSKRLDEIKAWLISNSLPSVYLERVQALLQEAAQKTLQKRTPPQNYQNLFKRLSLATGWQESCLRQFVVKKRQIVYLRSYNGSSVGLMQINERVWRGIYDLHKLRWNIRYNTRAGCEVLDLYVTKYIDGSSQNKRQAEKLKDDTLASLIYAMYNGGPAEFKKFLKRKQTGKFYQSDRLFMEKYAWVKKGQWQNFSSCVGVN